MNQKRRDIQRKLRILKHAEEIGSAIKTCRYFGIWRARFCGLSDGRSHGTNWLT